MPVWVILGVGVGITVIIWVDVYGTPPLYAVNVTLYNPAEEKHIDVEKELGVATMGPAGLVNQRTLSTTPPVVALVTVIQLSMQEVVEVVVNESTTPEPLPEPVTLISSMPNAGSAPEVDAPLVNWNPN